MTAVYFSALFRFARETPAPEIDQAYDLKDPHGVARDEAKADVILKARLSNAFEVNKGSYALTTAAAICAFGTYVAGAANVGAQWIIPIVTLRPWRSPRYSRRRSAGWLRAARRWRV